jgi:ABC-2 type transport system permease protein
MSNFIRIMQLGQLTSALFREIIREPGVLFWGIIFPILMSLGLGLAFTKKTDTVRKIAIITDSGIPENRTITTFLHEKCEKDNKDNTDNENWEYKYVIEDEKLGNSIFLFYNMKWDEAMKLLKRGTINVLIAASKDSIEYHFDPMNSDAELTYLKLSHIISNGELPETYAKSEVRPLTMTGTRYIDFLVPGLITMG